VLPDIKLLNSFRNTTAQVSQLQARPSWLIPKSGYQLPLRNTPDAANYYHNGTQDQIKNLSNIDNPISTEVQQDKCKDAIFKAFDIDIFRMQKENKEMTATEVQARVEEQMRMMSPMIGRIETEFLNPLIRSIYKVLIKYNRLPLLEGVGNIELDITYVSPLTKAQKSLAINGIEQVIGFFQHSGISSVYPEIYDNIDFDKCFKLLSELKGVPETILRSDKDVAQIRRQRQAMQLQQQLQAQQLQLSPQ